MLTALYIHIPFCDQICTYCDFHKEIATSSKQSRYVYSLLKELDLYKHELKDIRTIYIGGGTPTSLSKELLILLFQKINKIIDMSKVVEFTIEANPNDITTEKALLLFKHGINRVSLGVQTFHNGHLAFIGRAHRQIDIQNSVTILKQAFISNINIDLIFSLPNQTLEEVQFDLEQVLALDVKHISYYSLIFEEKTKLYHLYEQNKVSTNSEDLEALMYNVIVDTLTKNGFDHYEISNFSKKGYNSLHNTIYWKCKDYLGLGSGSHSLVRNQRFYNERNVRRYIEHLEADELPKREFEAIEPLREELIMGLRLLEGISIKDLEIKYNVTLFALYPKLLDFIEQGLLILDQHRLRFSREGLLLGNEVFGIF